MQDYRVSSVDMSREQTQLNHVTPDSAYFGGGTQMRKTASPNVSSNDLKTQQQIEELQEMCRVM